MTAFIVPNDDSGDVVYFDAVEAESHEVVVNAFSHPVEQGFDVTDHIRPMPDRITLNGYVSRTPISTDPFSGRGAVTSQKLDVPVYTRPPNGISNAVGAGINALFGGPEFKATTLVFDDFFDPIEAKLTLLETLAKAGTFCFVLTPIKFYSDMVIKGVSAPRTGGDSGVSFSVELERIRVVQTGSVVSPPTPADNVPGGKPLVNKGGQPKTEAAADQPTGSIPFRQAQKMGLL